MSTLLVLVLVLLLIGAVPTRPYSRGCGHAPSGSVGAALVAVLVLTLMGRV